MRTVQLVIAFVAGVLLYQVTVIFVGGILAAIAIPPAYFAWFGRQNANAAHAVLHLVGHALPISALIAGGTLATQRLLAGTGTSVLPAVLGGLLACFVYWLVGDVLYVPEGMSGELSPLAERLRQALLPPWWAVSTFLAPWFGFALAAWPVRKKREA
jgi:hypothetical protein